MILFSDVTVYLRRQKCFHNSMPAETHYLYTITSHLLVGILVVYNICVLMYCLSSYMLKALGRFCVKLTSWVYTFNYLYTCQRAWNTNILGSDSLLLCGTEIPVSNWNLSTWRINDVELLLIKFQYYCSWHLLSGACGFQAISMTVDSLNAVTEVCVQCILINCNVGKWSICGTSASGITERFDSQRLQMWSQIHIVLWRTL